MSFYWAKFIKIGRDTFRYDTRIYLQLISEPKDSDACIGAIVGKNPGSAKASDPLSIALQQISLDDDKLLPNVRSIVSKAYERAEKEIEPRGYIQVLNIFYLCNPDLDEAIAVMSTHNNPVPCQSESMQFPWVWYVWGGENSTLSKFKVRFSGLKAKRHFYFDPVIKKVIDQKPCLRDFARHTQGLTHDVVVDYISELIKLG